MSRRYLTLLVVGLVMILAWAAWPRPTAVAKVEYAQRTGQPCLVCHSDAYGGGALTTTGAAYAQGGYQWPIPEDTQSYIPSTFARILKLIAGYIHLATTVAWFGTIFYIHIIVRPQQLTSGIPKGEKKLGWICIVIMAVTGTVLTVFRQLETGAVFSGTWGTVFIIKLVQFALMVTLAGVATGILDRRMRIARRQAADASGDDPASCDTLACLDGKEGRKAVIAVDQKLYDVTASRLWREGVHAKRHQAGHDLTNDLNGAPHGKEVLERVPVVGVLEPAPVVSADGRKSAHRIFVIMAYVNLIFVIGILLCVAWWKWGFPLASSPAPTPGTIHPTVSQASAQCITCHRTKGIMPAQIVEWERSVMAQAGVGCHECHVAQAGDVDAMEHNGFLVSVLVTPQDCAQCHVREAAEFASSRHAQGGDILASLDNILGERVEGVAAAVLGCQQCHGVEVQLDDTGRPVAASWPNTGIGRINPDGSRGACSTCHTRHLFSVAVGREPSSCGNCHMGPDHPQKEIYEESKHGVAFLANRDHMALDQRPWVLGEDYSAAPTCATCHMSAIPNGEVNHDVGLRIAWTLRPEISVRLENWQVRRQDMKNVCQNCHSPGFYQNFFQQYDDAVDLYNFKFASPAQQIMDQLRAAGKLTPTQFDEPIEWTYYLLWHHEGRRARHGAAMMGPDYVQWHGFFEVADRFYNEFVPEAEHLLPGVTEPFLAAEEHQWRR